MSDPRTPLSGRTVLDLSILLPGPYATLLLGQLGARIVKVEPPTGDPMRQTDPGIFALVNAGKETVSLNLKDHSGQSRLAELVAGCDAVVTSYLPPTAERLGVSPAHLHAYNPKAVVCRVLGRTVHEADLAAHDLDILALAGAFSFGPAEGTYPLGLPVADLASGMTAALSLSAALHGPPAENRVVDVSMVDITQTWVALAGGLSTVDSWRAGVWGVPRIGGYGVFAGSDGREFVIAAVEDRYWPAVAGTFAIRTHEETLADRKARADELNDAIRAQARTAPAGDWVRRLQELGVPASPVRTPAEALEAATRYRDGVLKTTVDGRVALRFPAGGLGVAPTEGKS